MNLNEFQNNLSSQASEFTKVFTAHASKIVAAQQQFLQGQADAFKAQFEQVATNKDLASSAQALQNNLQPAAANIVKHAQELYTLSLAAQKDLSAKAQDGYKDFAVQANTAFEAGVKQLPNQGEPLVSMAKNAAQAVNAAFEQVADQVKTAQTNYETQIAKLFDGALNTLAGTAPVVAKAAPKK